MRNNNVKIKQDMIVKPRFNIILNTPNHNIAWNNEVILDYFFFQFNDYEYIYV